MRRPARMPRCDGSLRMMSLRPPPRPDRDTAAVYAGFRLVGIVNGWQFTRNGVEEAIMKIWMGMAVVASALAFSAPAAVAGTSTAPRMKAVATSGATDV